MSKFVGIFLKIMNRIEKLKEMLLQQPKDCFLHHALGLEWIKMGNLENALNCFLSVISNDENYVGTYYHLAKTYEKLGQVEQAVVIYEKGIQIATKCNDKHAKNELQMALDDILDV
jgi:Tfp pilus assembly protein PilF